MYRWYGVLGLSILGLMPFVTIGHAMAWATPSAAIASVLVTARRCERDHHLGVAVFAGLLEGLLHPGGLVLFPAMLAILAGIARGSRRVFPLPTALRRLIWATALAGIARVATSSFPAVHAPSTLAPGAWPFAIVGVFLTGLAAVILEELVDRWPALRHQFTRR